MFLFICTFTGVEDWVTLPSVVIDELRWSNNHRFHFLFYLNIKPLPRAMEERQGRPIRLLCRTQHFDWSGSSDTVVTKIGTPNRHTLKSLNSKRSLEEAPVAMPEAPVDSPCCSPVSVEQKPMVNNGSDLLDGNTKELTAHGEDREPSSCSSASLSSSPTPPHFKCKPYRTKTSMQGDVYNFLERPAGLKCFLYHFLVWVDLFVSWFFMVSGNKIHNCVCL